MLWMILGWWWIVGWCGLLFDFGEMLKCSDLLCLVWGLVVLWIMVFSGVVCRCRLFFLVWFIECRMFW